LAKRDINISGGAILVLALGGLAYAIYKGWIKLPDFFGVGEGYNVGGVPGAIGGVTYNLLDPSGLTLGEQIQEKIKSGEAERLYYEDVTPGVNTIGKPLDKIKPPTPEQIHYKAGEQSVAEGWFRGLGLFSAIPLVGNAISIPVGAALAVNRGKYLDTLDPEAKAWERYNEMERREEFMGTPAGIAARVLSLGFADIGHRIFWSPRIDEYPAEKRTEALEKIKTDPVNAMFTYNVTDIPRIIKAREQEKKAEAKRQWQKHKPVKKDVKQEIVNPINEKLTTLISSRSTRVANMINKMRNR